MNRLAFPPLAGRTLPVAAAVLALALAGCADMSGIGSTATLRDADSLGLQRAVAQHEGTLAANPVDSRWWTGFGNAQLNALIDEALAGNPKPGRGPRALARARAAIATARPPTAQVNGAFDASRQRFSSNYITGAAGRFDPGDRRAADQRQLGARLLRQDRAALDSAMGTANARGRGRCIALLLASNWRAAYVQWPA